MPELPEVETMKRQLLSKVKGKTIKKVEFIDYKKADPKIKKQGLSKIKGVRRRAKILLIDLANGFTIIVHVKLTGHFYFQPKGKNLKDKFTHVIFHFTDGSALLFEDMRKFGWMRLKKTNQADEYLEKEFRFGPEPLGKEFTLKWFKEKLEKKPSKIKPLLMDPKFVVGIGNIYAQEACYCAGVLPTRPAKSLSEKEVKKLYNCIRKILPSAIAHQGTSADTYVTLSGRKGTFEPLLKVYQRKEDPKGHKLKVSKLAGRGTRYCPQCQK